MYSLITLFERNVRSKEEIENGNNAAIVEVRSGRMSRTQRDSLQDQMGLGGRGTSGDRGWWTESPDFRAAADGERWRGSRRV